MKHRGWKLDESDGDDLPYDGSEVRIGCLLMALSAMTVLVGLVIAVDIITSVF